MVSISTAKAIYKSIVCDPMKDIQYYVNFKFEKLEKDSPSMIFHDSKKNNKKMCKKR